MTESQRIFFEQMAEGRGRVTDGHLGGPFDAWGLNPSTGRRIWQLGGAIRNKPAIDRRYIELAILVTGQFWQAQFEWFAHEPMARDAGVPENVIQAIKVGSVPEFADAADEACYQFCKVLLDHRKVDDTTYGAALGEFGERGIAELVNTCGMYTLVSMTLNTFEVDLPEGAEPPFPV
jgi:4-carboxymuconolactone decarboxylase